MQKKWIGVFSAVLCLGVLVGCGSASVVKEKEQAPSVDTALVDIVKLEKEKVAHSEMPVSIPTEGSDASVPMETPAPEATETTVSAPAAKPVESAILAPAETPVPEATETATPAHAETPTAEPTEFTASAAAETPVVKPAESAAPVPMETPADEAAEATSPAPAETPTAEPTESTAASAPEETPAAKPAETSTPAPVETPAPAPTETAKPVETPAASSGDLVKKSAAAMIDYSNTGDGYVMVQYTESTTKRLKVQVKGPATTYTYNLNQGEWTTFPLSDGNGSYQIKVLRNTTDNKYSLVLSVTHNVTLKDEFAPFIRPNQYVNYTAGSKTVAKAAELTRDVTAPLDKVAAVYNYVVNNLTYDKVKAANATSGYLPVLDTVLAEKKGICFDYAALMTGMLRSQGIPCKLVIGYAGNVYHAWISVWTEETGWLDNAIYFDGTTWQRMDPTFASTGNQSAEIMEYIGNNANYSIKYLY